MNTQDKQMPINTRKAWRPILRPVARLLIAAQLALVLQPLSALTLERGTPAANPLANAQLQRFAQLSQSVEQAKVDNAKAQQSPADQVSDKLGQAQELVAQIRSASTLDKSAKQQRLKDLLAAVRDGVGEMRAEFAAVRSDLQRRGLPAEILARHDDAVAQFEQRASSFGQIIAAAGSDEDRVQRLAEFFDKFPAKRKAGKIDPKKLPWSTPKPNTRAPAETQAAWYRNLYADQKIQLAQAGGTSIGPLQFNIPPEPGQAPTLEDLAPAEEIQLSETVRAQAAALGNNPVAILRWVHNNLEWIPSWGSLQGAEATLVMRRGNSVDIASATIALLRAAGVPARYAVGTVEVDAARLTNWIGGAESTATAINLLQQGGVATMGIASGGRITKVRMAHAWVQVYANWTPSRGARQGSTEQHVNPNGPLNAWVDVDPSYKQHTFTAPLDIAAAVPLDSAAVRSAVTTGAVVDAGGAISGMAESNVVAQLQAHGARVQTFLNSRTDLQLSDLIKTRQIVSDAKPMLAGVLPHPVIARQNFAALPSALRHTVTIKLFASGLDRSEDSPILSHRISLAALNYRRLGVTYEPASAADAQVISGAVAAGATSLPAYLINVRPALQIDGQSVAVAGAMRMGTEQYWTVSFDDPSGMNSGNANFSNTAGDEIVFGLNGNGITAEMVGKRYVEGTPETGAGNLEQAALRYWLQHDLFDRMAADSSGVMAMRMPSVIEFSAPLTVRYFFGVARSGSYKGLSGDGQRVLTAAASQTSGAVRNFMLMAGLQGSTIEGSVLDQLFGRPPETSVSTTQFFAIAMRQGLKLYAVTSDNAATVLPQLAVTQDVKDDISNMIAAGGLAFVPEREISHNGYTGVGYLLFDPQTGAGAYLIDGGRNGLNMPLCEGSASVPGGEISVQSLFASENLALGLVGLVDTAAESQAQRTAKQIAAKAIETAAKSAAATVAKRAGPRLLAGLLVPGANIILGVALAVELSIVLLMLVIEIKMILKELEIETMLRTDEDVKCKCKKTPDDPICECKKFPVPHNPPRAVPQLTVYDRRVDVHHTCADGSGNSYGGMDVVLRNKTGESISVDMFSEPGQLACEVKTSFKNQPYDPYTMSKWTSNTLTQVAKQKRIAESCGWSHCVIVNKPWMRDALLATPGGQGLDIRVNTTCGSGNVPPEPVHDEFPSPPLD
jgi:hypothetical protein